MFECDDLSSVETNNKKTLDYLEIFKGSDQLFNIMTEYLKLRNEYDEPLDAKKMRLLAEKHLVSKEHDYVRAESLMRTALKIMKACNGLL